MGEQPLKFGFMSKIDLEEIEVLARVGKKYTLKYKDGSKIEINTAPMTPQLQGVYEREWKLLLEAFND